MAINTASKTYTPPGGAGVALRQTTSQPYTSVVGGKPVAQATGTTAVGQPVTPEVPPTTTPEPTTMTTGVQGPVSPDTTTPQDTTDIDALAQIRTQMINELFSHDNNLKQQFTNPNIANPLLREQLAYQPQEASFGLLSSLNNLISTRKAELKAATKTLSPTEKKQYYMEQLQQEMQAGGGEFQDYVKAYKAYVPVNDIVEMYNTMNPDKPVDLIQAQAMGYKTAKALADQQTTYSDAIEGLDAVDRLDKASKAGRGIQANLYRIPQLRDLMGPYDPVANFETSRMAYAQELTKKIMGSNYPGVAKNIQDLIPSSFDSETIRQQKISELKGMLAGKIKEAERNAAGFALGKIPPSNMATTTVTQPTAMTQPTGPTRVTTSTGKSYSIVPKAGTSATTAIDVGGL